MKLAKEKHFNICLVSNLFVQKRSTAPYFFENGTVVIMFLVFLQVPRACKHEIKRVMRQRAHSVNLMPSIQNVCLSNLGMYCSVETNKGQVRM